MMRLVLIGFGVVGQGLAELLLEKRERLARDHGLPWQVVGIAGSREGSCYHPEGIDLAEALAQVKRGQSLSALGWADFAVLNDLISLARSARP